MPSPGDNRSVHFPAAGIDLSMAFSKQPNRPVSVSVAPAASQAGIVQTQLAPGTPTQTVNYARTTPVAVNVRGWEPLTQRLRGGSRNGLTRWQGLPQVVGSRFIVQDLSTLVTDLTKTPGGNVPQPSQSGRLVSVIAVGQGNVYSAAVGDTAWAKAANAAGTSNPPLNFSGLVFSTDNNLKLYYVDGAHPLTVFDPSDGVAGTVSRAVPATTDSQGNPIVSVFPSDGLGNFPRLIETWRGRLCLSGLITQPQNWFMSAVGQPTNFDYSPTFTTPTQAVAGNDSPLGTIGQPIMSMCPYNDDIMVFFLSNAIWMMNGDPMAGGQIDLVSTTIGGTFGRCWCMDPYGNIYFISNRCGLYVLVPGQAPQRISQPIEQLLQVVNTGTYNFRLFWDDRNQGLLVIMSPIITPAPTKHLYFEQRNGGWFQVAFGSPLMDPICGCILDGNTQADRQILIGSWDGYVRMWDINATTDDGIPIQSEVLVGPFLTQNLDEMTLYELQAVMGETSGEVNYQIYVGSTAESALQSQPVTDGLWLPGRNQTELISEAGHAIYFGISSSNPWACESFRLRVGTRGKVRQRTGR